MLSRPPRSACVCPPLLRRGARAFTLAEILVSMTILSIALSMTMGVLIAALKRADHTETALKGTAELRNASDVISQAVRSASQLPTLPSTTTTGLRLLVPPKDLPFVMVQEITFIDAERTTLGTKSTQRVMKLSDLTLPEISTSVWSGSGRPTVNVTSASFSDYFISAALAPTDTNISHYFSVGDTITIPATAFGPKTTGVINSISANSGQKTITLTNAVGVDVPNGTRILATSGRRLLFEVIGTGSHTGELRYYPDSSDLTKYTILARDIDPAPLSDPADSTSTRTRPFAIAAASPNYVTINLQQLPQATTTGRTLQGIRTTAFTRTDPTTQ